MSYEIKVHTMGARVVDFERRSHDATFFLNDDSHRGDGPETLSDRLNREMTSFVPCRMDGDTVLLNIAHVAYVELLEPPADLLAMRDVGARSSAVELELVNGEQLHGQMVFEARPEDRLSDLLNSRSVRFLPLNDRERTLYVQRNAIKRVRFSNEDD